MKRKIRSMVMACLFSLQILGCGRKQIIFEEDYQLSQKEEEYTTEESSQEEKVFQQETEEEPLTLFSVHVCGAVKNPSVYQVEEGTRVYQAVEAAGGFLEEADQDYLNLALEVEDGMQIRIPTKEETAEYGTPPLTQAGVAENSTGKVNLNVADEALLCTLPGIGESRARSIIKYRQENGDFQKPEDIMKVSGIKEAAYEKIKDYITVSK